MTKPICIYHGNCADGFTAAWAVWKRCGEEYEYHPGVYQSPPPDVTGRDVLIVDFSYKYDVLVDMSWRARSLLVLDHHKTAAEDLGRLPAVKDQNDWMAARDHCATMNMPWVGALFDMGRSGAGITWDFFHAEKPKPRDAALVNYVEDRDLWRFALPNSREVNAYIFAHSYTFENWDALAQLLSSDDGVRKAADGGAAIEKKHHRDVAELVGALRREMVVGGHVVSVCNLPYTLTSDAGHLMATGKPFAACYWDTAEGRVFSLRSTDDGLDVSEIAKMYGGGGHRNAAGFRVPFDRLSEFEVPETQ